MIEGAAPWHHVCDGGDEHRRIHSAQSALIFTIAEGAECLEYTEQRPQPRLEEWTRWEDQARGDEMFPGLPTKALGYFPCRCMHKLCVFSIINGCASLQNW
jgi:hypothetical protein